MNWDANLPYNDLPPLPPAVEYETTKVLKAVTEARAALASLDQASQRIPNPTVLINSIPLLEAQASSEIENIVTTTDELFRHAQDDAGLASPETRETLRYRTALFRGIASIAVRPLSVSTAVEVCTTIHQREMRVRQLPGTFIGNPVTKKAVYTPPTGESIIRDKLSNWESFIHTRADIDPLVVLAVSHYQFEAIHPFEDGNGRTGRIINMLYLVTSGLIQMPILYLSRYIIQHKDEYYRLLLEVTTKGAWEAWILFMLEGIRQTAISTLKKIDAIQALQIKTRESLRSETTAGANADLLDVLFEHPYCRISNVIERCEVSRPTATKWLNILVEAGILQDVKVGREKLFLNSEYVKVLSRIEADD